MEASFLEKKSCFVDGFWIICSPSKIIFSGLSKIAIDLAFFYVASSVLLIKELPITNKDTILNVETVPRGASAGCWI